MLTTTKNPTPDKDRDSDTLNRDGETSSTLVFTVFENYQAKRMEETSVDWSEVSRFLIHDHKRESVTTKKELRLFCAGTFDGTRTADGCLRSKESMTSLSALVVDYDEGNLGIDKASNIFQAQGLIGVVAPTPSWTPEKPRWRAVFPFKATKYKSQGDNLESAQKDACDAIRAIGVGISRESNVLSQSYFFGLPAGKFAPSPIQFDGGVYIDQWVKEYTSADRTASSSKEPADFGSLLQKPRLTPEFIEELWTIIRTGAAGVHEALLSVSLHLLNKGVPKDQVILKLEQAMNHWNDGSSRWRERFDEIPRIVEKGAVKIENKQREREQEKAEEVLKAIPHLDIKSQVKSRGRDKYTEFILDGFIAAGTFTMAGAWGAGKSTNLIPLFLCCTHLAPASWGFNPSLRRHVIWVTEATGQAHDVLYAVRTKHEIDEDEIDNWFHIFQARRINPQALATGVSRLAKQLAYTLPNGFVVNPLVVLDTYSANMDLDNESDNSEVAKAVSALREELGPIPLGIIGHTPKGVSRTDLGSISFRGAGSIEADTEANLYLIKDDETQQRFLVLGKHRFTAGFEEVHFGTDTHQESVATPWGETQFKTFTYGVPKVGSAAVRLAVTAQARAEAKEQRVQSAEAQKLEMVLEVLRKGGLKSNTPRHIYDAMGKAGKGSFTDLLPFLAAQTELGNLVAKVNPKRTDSTLYFLPEAVDLAEGSD